MATEIVHKNFIPGTPDSKSPSGWATDQKGVAAATEEARRWAAEHPDRLVSVHSDEQNGAKGTAVEKHVITEE